MSKSLLVLALGVLVMVAENRAHAEDSGFNGFVEVEPYKPNTEQRHCANYSKQNWKVELVNDEIRISEKNGEEHYRTLAVKSGLLKAKDLGEWGGGLALLADGKETPLFSENTSYLFPLKNDQVIAFGGTAHLTLDQGYAIFLDCSDSETCKITTRIDLPGDPEAVSNYEEGNFIVATVRGVFAFNSEDKTSETLFEGDYSDLYPNSVVRMPDGEIIVGMRYAIAHLIPRSGHYRESWLVKKTCVGIKDYESVYGN